MDTINYQEEIIRLNNLLTTEKRERRQEKECFFATIKATYMVIKDFEDEQKSHNETKRNYEQKDVLCKSLEDKYKAELSDSHQQVEHLRRELEKEMKTRREIEDMFFIVLDEKVELYNWMAEKAQAKERQFEIEKRNFMKDLEQKDVLYQSLEDKYKAELSDSHQQVEHLRRELEKEMKTRREIKEMTFTVVDEKVELYNRMAEKARAKERQFEIERRNFMKDLEQKDVLYQSLEDKYRAELSDSRHLIEKVKQELKSEQQAHLDTRQENQSIILSIQAEKEALGLQLTQAAEEMERLFGGEKRSLLKHLEEKDVLYQSLEEKYKSDLFNSKQLAENVQRDLDRERKDHLDEREEKLNIILSIQAEKEAIGLQMIKAADEMERLFGQEKRKFEKNLEQKDVLYQSLEDKYKAELSDSRQQVEHLRRELEKEMKAHKEIKETYLIFLDEKFELYNRMAEKARAKEGQFEIEKRNFMKDLEQKDVLYQSLEDKYKVELSDSHQQVEHLRRELEKETDR
ncbi:cingulin-like [Nothobranchius furzeri]|uniref:Cingulin-like n=1 Tax=Nothobranchius furzeri TaxID=105023 RepID=A0A9D2XS96_NOTFU|nr:cingulin-like [Nothobranchius furzeri]